MQDRPTVTELIAAVQHFVEHEVLPTQTDQRLRFRARVAANALGIVLRELYAGETPIERERLRLQALLLRAQPSDTGTTTEDTTVICETHEHNRVATVRQLRLELARQIRSGIADHGPWRQEVLTALRASVHDKLMISNPKFVAAPK